MPTRFAVRLGSLGYGIPGTVLAIGVLIPLAGLDNAVDGLMRADLGISTAFSYPARPLPLSMPMECVS